MKKNLKAKVTSVSFSCLRTETNRRHIPTLALRPSLAAPSQHRLAHLCLPGSSSAAAVTVQKNKPLNPQVILPPRARTPSGTSAGHFTQQVCWTSYQQIREPRADHILQVCFVLWSYILFVLPPLRHKGPLHFLCLLQKGPQVLGKQSWKGQSTGKDIAVCSAITFTQNTHPANKNTFPPAPTRPFPSCCQLLAIATSLFRREGELACHPSPLAALPCR